MGMPKLREMTGAALGEMMTAAANRVVASLPPKTLFVLLAFDPPDQEQPAGGVAQYIANCERSSVVASLREAADRIERGEIRERSPFSGPTFTCPRCGAVSHNRDDVRLGYCGRCHRFHGTDEV